MVKFYGFILLISFALFTSEARAQNFEAFVDSGEIAVGQTVNVKLELTGASPTGVPDISQLPSGLKITAQAQQSAITIVNGRQVGSISWIYTLLPNREGVYNMPEFPITTEIGTLHTRPFKIEVKESSELPSNVGSDNVFIEAKLDKDVVYLGQPAIYTIRIFSRVRLANLDLRKPSAENMVIDQIGEAKSTTQTVNNVVYNVIIADFLVTPTKPGRTTIGSSVLSGRVANDNARVNSFSDGFSVVDTNLAVEPFSIATKPLSLNIKEPVKGITPWLVANKFELQDEIITDENGAIKAKVGEPFSRKIMAYAEGRLGNNMPDLEATVTHDNFKIYADKAITNDEVKLNAGVYTLIGKKVQNFNYIAQQPGEFELPEIKINWWNPNTDVLESATIPARKVIAEGTAIAVNQPSPNNQAQAQQPQQAEAASTTQSNTPTALPKSMQYQAAANTEPQAENTAENTKTNKNPFANISTSNLDFETILIVLAGAAFVILIILKKGNTQQTTNSNQPPLRRAMVSENQSKQATATQPQPSYGRKIIDSEPLAAKTVAKPGFYANKTDEIDNLRDANELVQFIQNFATKNLQQKPNTNIITIAEYIRDTYNIDSGIVDYAKQLDANIFAGKEINFPDIRAAFKQVLKHISENKKEIKKVDNNIDNLNPF
jgi:hypothetical protein